MTSSDPLERLDRAFAAFMRYYLVHLNPILHQTEYQGRSYSEFEIYVVMALSACGPLRPTGLSRGLRIEKGSLTSVLRRLRGLGLIVRRDAVEDERSYQVELTKEGEAFVDHLAEQRRQGFRALFDSMDRDELEIAVCGLDVMTAHLRTREEEIMPWAKTTPPRTTNWRSTASPEDLQEYDAFGPWIYQVHSEEDMPRRFRPYYEANKEARFLFKIPRDIERAKALPGWDLYTAMLAIHDDHVVMMRLDRDMVVLQDVAMTDIVAVNTFANLLAGAWSLLLRDGSRIDLSHNTVSANMMAQVTDFIRSRWTTGGSETTRPNFEPVSVLEEHFFRYTLAMLRRSSAAPVTPIHFEPKDRWCRNDNGRLSLSTGLMLIDTPDEFVIVNRGRPTRTWYLANYASNTTIVPYRRIASFSVKSPPEDQKMRAYELLLSADAQVIDQFCFTYPEGAVKALAARGIPQL